MDAPSPLEDSPKSDNPYFVNIEEAIERADNFFANLEQTPGTRTHRIVKNIETYRRGTPLTRSSETEPDFYVINYIDERGFALVSADTRRLPVYAFSTEGHLALSDTLYDEGLKECLTAYASFPIQPENPFDSVPTEGTLQVLVPPMLDKNPQHWDQISLNKYVCSPSIPNAPVGCVALATAQIMSYFRWPNRWPIKGYNTAKERYVFNWTEMLKTKSNDATARLLQILGRPEYLNVEYGEKASSATGDSICSAMKKLGYKRPKYIDYDTDTVLQTLYKKSPLIMTGKDKRPEGKPQGHAWTVDGLAQYTLPVFTGYPPIPIYHLYLHFIWGSGGGHNGYFYYDSSSQSFEAHARAFDEVDDGYGKDNEIFGNIDYPWGGIRIVIDFDVDVSLFD